MTPEMENKAIGVLRLIRIDESNLRFISELSLLEPDPRSWDVRNSDAICLSLNVTKIITTVFSKVPITANLFMK